MTEYGAYRDRVGSVDVASIGNICDEVTLLSQRLKAATGCIPILAHLSHHLLLLLLVLSTTTPLFLIVL